MSARPNRSPAAPIESQNLEAFMSELNQRPNPSFPSGDRITRRKADPRQLTIIRRLIFTLAVFAVVSVGFYSIFYLSSGLTQSFLAAGLIAAGVLLSPLVYWLAKRGQSLAAGLALVVGVALAYAGNELAWKSLTIYHVIGGSLLVYLCGNLTLPRRPVLWLTSVLGYLGVLWAINRAEIFPRFDAIFSPELQIYALASNILLALAVLGQSVLALRTRKIRTRLLSSFVLLILLPAAATSAISSILSAQNSQLQALRQFDSVASLKVNRIRAWEDSLQTNLLVALPQQGQADQIWMVQTLISDFPSTKTFYIDVHRNVVGRFQQTLASSQLFSEIFILSPDGTVILSTDSAQEGKDKSNREYYLEGKTRSFITPPYLSPELGVQTVLAATPIIDGTGVFVGVLVGRANLQVLDDIMAVREGLGETGETYLVSESNLLLTPSIFPAYEKSASRIHSDGITYAIANQWNGSGVYQADRGETVIGAYRWLPELKVALIAEQEQAEALRGTIQSLYLNLAITLGAVVLGILAGLVTTNQITNPLARLATTAERIASGELHRTVEISQEDEIGDLAYSFNTMTAQLRELVGNLELRVEDRTRELARRSVQLQVAAEIARDATAVRDLDLLLNRAVNLIRERFGFYHAGIFLVDDRGEFAVLRSATGEAGREMFERGHRLKIGETGMVGYVAQVGLPRIALDVEADASYFKNPLLPNTRSEAAIPLKTAGKVIGILDVQSTEVAAFDEETVQILQTMGDQLAVAIANARLFGEMEQALKELEAVHGRYTQETWASVRDRLGRPFGLRYRSMKTERDPDARPEASQALQNNRTVLTKIQPGDDSGEMVAVAVPLRLRGQVIGVVNLRFQSQAVSPDLVSTIEEMANRLALFFENARLLQEAQHLALREQQINVLTTRIRSSANIEAILQNTVRELGKALGASRTFIQLGVEPRTEAETTNGTSYETN